jgi:ATP-binding cassette, subfamily B, bacterial
MRFPFYKQLDLMDCGPTCLRSIAKFYGKNFSAHFLREKCFIDKDGVSMWTLSQVAEELGFNVYSLRLNIDQLSNESILPCIVHWRENHFVVVYKIDKKRVYVSDPAKGLVTFSRDEFQNLWTSARTSQKKVGVALFLTPTTRFFNDGDENEHGVKIGNIMRYFLHYKKLFVQLLLSLFAGTLLGLVFPFFTQAVVDVGIATKDIEFIHLILIGQLLLFVGSTFIDFVRGWIILHISTRISLSLLSNYWLKLTKLPISYFDVKMTGDILQRMGDNKRIESFLTGSTLNVAFSLINLIVFTCVILTYDLKIFFIFFVGSIAYFIWVLTFLKPRKNLDSKRFDVSSANQSLSIQMIQGMPEIKLSNSERQKRWEWERVQARSFKLNIRSLALSQFQQGGAFFINQTKNILVTFLSAKAVVDGGLTLGGMIAIQYIIGQLNSPIQQFIFFIQGFQDAKISLERINEIHLIKEEEPGSKSWMKYLPSDQSIYLRNLNFKYNALEDDAILENLNISIPAKKITAIVGMSGSGKTTLLKLLLKFYEPTSGEIKIGDANFKNISPSFWRKQCGVVMQEGFIFSDSILNNICIGDESPDWDRVLFATRIANIQSFVESLPSGYNTKIGMGGKGISQGQKQRLLIARAIYKDPEYIFFDEATNALDSNNEKTIMNNLVEFTRGRTVVIVAHRLSTVKSADQIVVLNKGKVVEIGTHDELTVLNGEYFKLVKNQMELTS